MARERTRSGQLGGWLLAVLGTLSAGCAAGSLDGLDQVSAEEGATTSVETDGHDIEPGVPATDLDAIPAEPGVYVEDGLGAELIDELSEAQATDKKLFPAQPLSWVSDTTTLPNRTATQLIVTHADGYMTRCSGTFVAPDAVLTNAHCVYNKGRGGWAYSVEVAPGKNGSNYLPYGRTWGRKLYCPSQYRNLDPQNSKVIHDYAIVRTHAKLGDVVGILELAARPHQVGSALRLRGYPRDDYPHHMYTSADVVRKTYANGLFYHQASTLGGMSGASVLDGTTIFGIHTGEEPGGTNNDGVLFTTAIVDTLRSWATL